MLLSTPRGLTMCARISATIVLASAGACTREMVEWDDTVERIVAASSGGGIAIDSAGRATAVGLPPGPAMADACRASVRAARRDDAYVAAWWTAAPSNAARLMFARSRDGGTTWSTPVVVDARDAGARGCDRPAPAIALGEASEYLHLAYWIEPPEGAGVFFSHSMDAGATFHAPVAVAYGGVASHAAVASLGDTVAVVHEDPNSRRPRLLLALSRTAGHIFEHRLALPETSTPQTAPRIIIRPGELFVGWSEPGDSMLFVRRGRLLPAKPGT